MTELDRMILAARQIGEVVGEDLFINLYICPEYGSVWLDYVETDFLLSTADALDLLTARVWEAVRRWSYIYSWTYSGISVARRGFNGGRSIKVCYDCPDLPSAVAAIWEHYQNEKNPLSVNPNKNGDVEIYGEGNNNA